MESISKHLIVRMAISSMVMDVMTHATLRLTGNVKVEVLQALTHALL